MKQLRLFLFLPLALVFCLLLWFFANYEIFTHSRTLLPFAWSLLCLVIFLLSLIGMISIPFIYLFGKKPPLILWQATLFGLAMPCFWLLLAPHLPRSLPTGSDLLKFDSSAWKKDVSVPLPKDFVTARQKMLRDLVENVLPGKSKDEILDLLGPATETAKFQGTYDLIYSLGPERDNIFPLDYEWVLIHLKDDRFKKYSIRAD